MNIESALIHGGVDGDERTGAVNVPIYQTSTYKQIALGQHKGYEYSRTGNPTREAVEKLIAELESGNYGFAFASGMAAISAVTMLFKSGDRFVISENVYGGTFRVLDKCFSQFGLKYSIVDTNNAEALERELKDDTDGKVRALLIESPANPLLGITDIKSASDLAKKYGALTIVDNTFMTPYLQRPIELGADIVVHSATKYLGGHSDLVAGLVVVNDKELADKLYFIQNATGGVLGPFDSFLLIRGIKTLAVRMDRHLENAQTIADYLDNHQAVSKVYYPGLASHKGYDIHKQQASGGGGVISFILNDGVDLSKFFSNIEMITLGESLGGVESLACHPYSMTHASIPKELREKLGICYQLVRLSVGIENADDLIQDLDKALKAASEK